MANAIATVTYLAFPNGKDQTQRRELLYGNVGLSAGGLYPPNGIPLNWAALSASGAREMILSSASQPQYCVFFSQAGGGYLYVFDVVHNTLRIFSGGVELANGAAITADTIGFRAEYVRGF